LEAGSYASQSCFGESPVVIKIIGKYFNSHLPHVSVANISRLTAMPLFSFITGSYNFHNVSVSSSSSSCHRFSFFPGTSPLEPVVNPTTQASSLSL
jgi:hypothetical protein